jgi:precorrin-4 C11-methyltransferase
MARDSGMVTFIGAGPGDPELLTLKARRLIGEADVIVYAGSLVDEAMLAHARPDTPRHDSAGMTLDEQIALMREAASEGKTVARLHTGDPSIYGAIFEQMRRLRALGIPYRVVPGVSSAFATAAALGVELTIPGGTQTVIFTRLEGRTPVPESESLRLLAAHRSSLVLFLSAGMVARVVDELWEAGYADDTPVAVAFRVTWPDERIIRGTLADIVGKIEAAEITHHALIVVSPALDERITQAVPDSHLYGTAFDRARRQDTTAIITLTRGGTATGRMLLECLPDAVLYAPERFAEAGENVRPYTESVRQVLQSSFQRHRALVCVMAVGIVMRDLAPLLRSKHADPALVVLDEAAQYAVSLLGGHKGGANRLARQVADLLGGQMVLTTSSDVQSLPALDLLGEDYSWRLENGDGLTAAQAALVNGDPLGVVQHAGDESWLPSPLPDNLTRYPSFEALIDAAPAASLIVSHRVVPDAVLEAIPAFVVYRPADLCVGVGCNRGTPAAEIDAAIRSTAACQANGWPLQIFSRGQIASIIALPNPSPAARKALGVPGVAEPAAMLAAGADKLLVEKRKYENVTVAVVLKEGGA